MNGKGGYVSSNTPAPWKESIAGAAAGMATVVLLHPLDLLRTRLQVQDGRLRALPLYRSLPQAVSTVYRMEGMKGFYAGILPAIVANTASWALYFFFYSHRKQMRADTERRRWNKEVHHNNALIHLFAAAEAGAMTSLLTNPIWLVKTRLQLQVKRRKPPESTVPETQKSCPPFVRNCALCAPKPYNGVFDCVRSIWNSEGLRGFYSGIGPSLILVSHGAIQFVLYEELKTLALKLHKDTLMQDDHRSHAFAAKPNNTAVSLPAWQIGAVATAAKFCATLVTYPYMVIRSRMQMRPSEDGQRPYTSMWQTAKSTWRHEGTAGFYRGFLPHILRVAPTAGITFIVYEHCLRALAWLPDSIPVHTPAAASQQSDTASEARD